MSTSEGTMARRAVRLSLSSGVLIVVAAVLGVLAVRVFVDAHRPLSWAAAAVVGAVAFEPIVARLARRVRRVPAVLLCFVVVGGATMGIAYLAFDDLDEAVDRLAVAAPDAAGRIEGRHDRIGQVARDLELVSRVDDAVEALEDRFGEGGGATLRSTALTAPAYLAGGILVIFLMSYGPRLGEGALGQVPEPRRQRVAAVVSRASSRAREAGLLTLAHCAAVGVLASAAAALLDLPAPAALGLAAGISTVLPYVGIVLGAVPLLLLTLGFQSGLHVAAVGAVAVALQVVDLVVVRPRIDRHVRIGLLMPFVVTVLAHAVYGVGAALFGLAYAIFGLAVLDELHWDDPEQADGPPIDDGTLVGERLGGDG